MKQIFHMAFLQTHILIFYSIVSRQAIIFFSFRDSKKFTLIEEKMLDCEKKLTKNFQTAKSKRCE